MSGFFPIFKRELFSMFVTPLAWVTLSVFLGIQGLNFFMMVSQAANQPLGASLDVGPVQVFFGGNILIYLPLFFICPLLTMRLFAEERRSGTIEALLTTPVGTLGLVLAKYLAALVVYVAMWAPTGLYMMLVTRYGELDTRVVLTSYFGLFLIGSAYIALGTLASALTKSQLMAALFGVLAIVGLFIVGVCEFIMEPGAFRDVCAHISVWTQMSDASKGILDSRRVVFDLSLVFLSLFVTVRAVDAWRWG